MFSFSLRKLPFLLALRCLRADVSYFLCCPRATKEIGDVCTQATLFAAGDVSHGRTSATQRQKIHTDDANQCLQNSPVIMGFQIQICSVFTCRLVDFGKVLCSSANDLQQNSNASSREEYIPQILTVLLEILRVYI